MSAVRLDATPGLISGSPIFLFFKFASGSSTISPTSLNFNCVTFVQHFLFNSCSAVLCVLSYSSSTWASCRTSVLIQNVLSQVQPFRTSATFQLILLMDCLVSAACSLLLRSTDCQHTDSRIANTKHHHFQDVSHSVSSLNLLASTAAIHQCGQACRQKLLASTSCSIWLHPLIDRHNLSDNKFSTHLFVFLHGLNESDLLRADVIHPCCLNCLNWPKHLRLVLGAPVSCCGAKPPLEFPTLLAFAVSFALAFSVLCPLPLSLPRPLFFAQPTSVSIGICELTTPCVIEFGVSSSSSSVQLNNT